MVFGYAVLKRDMLVLTMRTLSGVSFHGEVDYEANQLIWFSTKESINLRKACRLLGKQSNRNITHLPQIVPLGCINLRDVVSRRTFFPVREKGCNLIWDRIAKAIEVLVSVLIDFRRPSALQPPQATP
jgi:hypothetical protein